MSYCIGTAGWTVPKQHLELFPAPPEDKKLSHLQRYSSRFLCVEINSSFHRPHRRGTWERWAAATPDHFRFAVKMSKLVTHKAKLVNTGTALLDFFNAVSGLGNKLGPVLVQLPPRLEFDMGLAHEFFTTLRELHRGALVVEPRHPTWFNAPVDRLLRDFEVAQVAADPPKGSDLAGRPGGWPGLRYWRLHGAPRIYYSDYDEPWLQAFAERLQAAQHSSRTATELESQQSWIIFDNTALGHAASNAIQLESILASLARKNAP